MAVIDVNSFHGTGSTFKVTPFKMFKIGQNFVGLKACSPHKCVLMNHTILNII